MRPERAARKRGFALGLGLAFAVTPARAEVPALAGTGAATQADEHARASAQDLVARGVAARTRGDLSEAIDVLRRAVALAPEATGPRFELGVTLAWHGDLDAALVELGAARARAPRDRGLRLTEARVLGWAGRHDDATRALTSLREEAPDDAEVLVALGDVRRAEYAYEDARVLYDEALARSPRDEDALRGRELVRDARRVDVRAALGGSSTQGGPWLPQGEGRLELPLRPTLTPFVGYRVDTSSAYDGRSTVALGDAGRWIHVGEAGVKTRLGGAVDAVFGFRSQFVPATSWHGPFAEGYVKHGKHLVSIVGGAPMAAASGQLGHLSHAGLQGIVKGETWALVQVFRADDTRGGASTSVLATAQVAPFDLPLRAKVGVGRTWHDLGAQTLWLASGQAAVSARLSLGVGWESLRGFLARDTLRATAEVGL